MFLRHLAGNACHLQNVLVALTTQAVTVQCFVGHGERVEGTFNMSNGSMQVDGLDWVASDKVNDVKNLRQLQEILEVLTVACVASAIKLHEVWWAGYRTECHPVATDVQGVRRVSRMQLKFRRASLDGFHHHLGVESNAVVRDLCAILCQQVAGFRQQEVDSVIAQNAQRRSVDGL